MSIFHSISILAADVDGLGTEVPNIDQVAALTGYVIETHEVRKINAKPLVESDEQQFLGNFTLISNKWKYDFEPSTVPILHDDTLQSIEEKFQTNIIDKTYHWLVLGEVDGSAPPEWTKRYPVQPQAVKNSASIALAIAVNLLKYDINYDAQKGISEIDMQFQARELGTVS